MQHLDLEKDREILAALKISRSTIIAAVKNGVRKIQAAAYNGARTVFIFLKDFPLLDEKLIIGVTI